MCVPSRGSAAERRRLNAFNVIQKRLQKLQNSESGEDDLFQKRARIFRVGSLKMFDGIKRSAAYRLLTSLTQQAHLITALALITVAFIVNPDHHHANHSKLLNFIYLAAFATYLGTQIWMTFMSGLSLYFTLPRHQFGEIQRILFPKYFTFNGGLCFVMLTIFARNHDCENFSDPDTVQMYSLAVSFLINLLIRLYLAPPLVQLIPIKNKMERSAGFGGEIGRHDVGQLKLCPVYLPIYKLFRKVHMTIAIGNLATMALNVFHLYYLSSKLCML